jgi:hypothetical protein
MHITSDLLYVLQETPSQMNLLQFQDQAQNQ